MTCGICGQAPVLVADDGNAAKLLRLARCAAVQEFAALVIFEGIGRDPDDWHRLLERIAQVRASAGRGDPEARNPILPPPADWPRTRASVDAPEVDPGEVIERIVSLQQGEPIERNVLNPGAMPFRDLVEHTNALGQVLVGMVESQAHNPQNDAGQLLAPIAPEVWKKITEISGEAWACGRELKHRGDAPKV